MTSEEIYAAARPRPSSRLPLRLGALTEFPPEMDLRQRSNLVQLEAELHRAWGLGQNCILSWSPHPAGVALLVVPHYAVAEYTAVADSATPGAGRVSERFIMDLICGFRQLSPGQMQKAARLLQAEPLIVHLREPLSGSATEVRSIEMMVKRYGISYVENRAVALFDIVGFSLLSPFEQMTQLNSLSYSLNSAYAKMLEGELDINFARSSTGDGFYIWNREGGCEANRNLYHFMHLVLADNAIARSKARVDSVPRLRAAFHVGSCYEFHQAEGLNPTVHDYIVGEVTIELARMIERAMPGQIFVGDFRANGPIDGAQGEGPPLDAIRFVDHARHDLSRLRGIVLSGERISAIKCYLTGERLASGGYSIRKLEIADKHGLCRCVYNAKVNIYREKAEPILLGIEDRIIRQDGHAMPTAELLARD
ncbi:MAG: hypothetical protein P8172_11750 [Gammaproteobacteria bacterium]